MIIIIEAYTVMATHLSVPNTCSYALGLPILWKKNSRMLFNNSLF